MAILTAVFEYDVDEFRLKFYDNQFESHFLEEDVNNPFPDNYTIFTDDQALHLEGAGFGYSGNGAMTEGWVRGFGEYFYNEVEGADEWFFDPIYELTRAVKVSAQDFWNALQTAKTSDDLAVLSTMLSGNDTFRLSGGNDRAKGFDGNDIMAGRNGHDVLKGMDGRDKLYGGNQKDRLFGGDGNDILRGGNGHDKSVGGAGSDTFRFLTGDDKEVIMDFEIGVDVIDLAGLTSVRHFKDLSNNHLEQVGNNVEIDARNGDRIIIKNVDIDDLSRDDFLF